MHDTLTSLPDPLLLDSMRQRQERRAGDPSYEHVDIGSSSSDNPAPSAIKTPDPLIQLAPSSVPVLDADEEVSAPGSS